MALGERNGFFDWQVFFPSLAGLLEKVEVINLELAEIADGSARWHDWPETSLYRGAGESWKVIPFCYTFPADTGVTQWVESSCNILPRTSSILRELPGLRTALLSKMGPNTSLTPHDGWREISNHVLRCHLPLKLPGRCVSGVSVGDVVRFHEEGDFLCFDDALVHSGFNRHPTAARTVLIFDLVRPAGVPLGQASGGATAELENFMAYFH